MRSKIEFELGETVHKQRLVLIKEMDGSFTLIKHAANQRDETDRISGMTELIVKNMLQAIEMKLKV